MHPPGCILFPYTTLFRSKSLFWLYCGENLTIWKCLADRSVGVVNRESKSRVRSTSMNVYLGGWGGTAGGDRKSTRLNSSHLVISYAVLCLKKNRKTHILL